MKYAGRIQLPHRVCSDMAWVLGKVVCAEAGKYDAYANRNGAVAVKLGKRAWLGIKPGEFTWTAMLQWMEEFWDGNEVRQPSREDQDGRPEDQ